MVFSQKPVQEVQRFPKSSGEKILRSFNITNPLSHEKISLSRAELLLLLWDGLRQEIQEICLVKQHKKYKITRTHVSHLACFLHLMDVSRIVCSWLKWCTLLLQFSRYSIVMPWFISETKRSCVQKVFFFLVIVL